MLRLLANKGVMALQQKLYQLNHTSINKQKCFPNCTDIKAYVDKSSLNNNIKSFYLLSKQ